MRGHVDILDQRESLSRPFLGSIAFHVAVCGSLLVYGIVINRGRESFGSPNPGGTGGTPIVRRSGEFSAGRCRSPHLARTSGRRISRTLDAGPLSR